jgi:hypothetical protein
MRAFMIPLLRNVHAFENIRSAVCAAQEYQRELCSKSAGPGKSVRSAIVL